MSDLVEVLEQAAEPATASGGVIVSNDFADDAAVVRVGDGNLLTVLTADVIAPIVDDAETFGAIAAANSLSDVYAMGGTPKFALNLAFFPDSDLPGSVLSAIMAGAASVCRRVGVPIVGGHTVRDPELKFGLSVTGEVAADAILSNRDAIAGQALVLSKALGTGVIGTAIKKQLATDEEAAAAVESMTTLNDKALELAVAAGATSCTDVTGFGLLGHLRNILNGSQLTATLAMHSLPLLPGFRRHVLEGRVPGGSRANLKFVEPHLEFVGERDEVLELAAADAQTSGGLLVAVPPNAAAALAQKMRDHGMPAAVVGTLASPAVGRPAGTVVLEFS